MIENAQVNVFLREHFRPTCTDAARVLVRITAVMRKAQADGVLELIPNTDEVISDGSVEEGQPAITGGHVHAVVSLFADLLAQADQAGTRAPSLLRIARNVLP